MPLTIQEDKDDIAFKNIQRFTTQYLAVLDYTDSLPAASNASHIADIKSLYEAIEPYDARSHLDLKANLKDSLFMADLIFCELIFFARKDWNEFRIGKYDLHKNFTFSKGQWPKVKALLAPFVASHKLMYVLSELKDIDYDIDVYKGLTISETSELSYSTNHLVTRNLNDFNQKMYDAVCKGRASSPVASAMMVIAHNDATIREVSEYPIHQDFAEMPALITENKRLFGVNNTGFCGPAIKYLSHVTLSPEIN